MIRVRLNPADCAALGAPEEMLLDDSQLRLREARALSEATGVDVRSLQNLGESLLSDLLVRHVLVWLALARSGIDVPFDGLDFDLLGLRIAAVPDAEGNAPAPRRRGPSRRKSTS